MYVYLCHTCCLTRSTFYKQLSIISKPTLRIVCTLPKRAKYIEVKVDGHRAALPTDAKHFFPRSAKIGTWSVFVSHFILCSRPDLAGPRPTLSPIARFASSFRNALFPKYTPRSLVPLVPKLYGFCKVFP